MRQFVLSVFIILFCCGCVKQKAFVCFNDRPITEETVLHPVSEFQTGSKIYYLFFSKKPLENNYIRVQLFKTGDNISRGGYEMVRVKEYRLMKDEVYYQTDYFVIHQPVSYILQVYNPEKLNLPLANGEFVVK